MGENYIFEYINENEFKKLERSVKKYNMLAYKKLLFEYYPKLKNGEFLGEIVEQDDDNSEVSYHFVLPSDALFEKVHGKLVLHYKVLYNRNVVLLETLEPHGLLSEGHKTELEAYKGIMISKTNAEKDMFKINLLNLLQK